MSSLPSWAHLTPILLITAGAAVVFLGRPS